MAAGDAPRQEALKRGERPAREIEDDECLLGEDSDLPTTDNNQGGSEEAAVLTDDDDQDMPLTPADSRSLSRCTILTSTSIFESIGAASAASPTMSSSSNDENTQRPSLRGPPTPFRCSGCSDRVCFATKEDLSRHYLQEHDDIGDKDCPNCGHPFHSTHECVLHWHLQNCWSDKGKGKATSPEFDIGQGPNDPHLIEYLLSVGFSMEHLELMGIVVYNSTYANVFTANGGFLASHVGIQDTGRSRELPDLPSRGGMPNQLADFQHSRLLQASTECRKGDPGVGVTATTSIVASTSHGEDAVSKRFRAVKKTPFKSRHKRKTLGDSYDGDLHGEKFEESTIHREDYAANLELTNNTQNASVVTQRDGQNKMEWLTAEEIDDIDLEATIAMSIQTAAEEKASREQAAFQLSAPGADEPVVSGFQDSSNIQPETYRKLVHTVQQLRQENEVRSDNSHLGRLISENNNLRYLNELIPDLRTKNEVLQSTLSQALKKDPMYDTLRVVSDQLAAAKEQLASQEETIACLQEDLQTQALAEAKALKHSSAWQRLEPVDKRIAQQAHAIDILRRENARLSMQIYEDERSDNLMRGQDIQHAQFEDQGHRSSALDVREEIPRHRGLGRQASPTVTASEESETERLRRGIGGLHAPAVWKRGPGRLAVLHEVEGEHQSGLRKIEFSMWTKKDGRSRDDDGDDDGDRSDDEAGADGGVKLKPYKG